MHTRIIFLLFLGLSFHINLSGQVDTNDIVQLPSIEINALRIPTNEPEQPFAVSTYQSSSVQGTRQQLSLQEYISQTSGLFSLNANNYAQDLRIAIRGFGARSAFGIRGIKIIVDGIPETTPDGQGQIDNLNIGSIDRIEILKGPAATLYGNASGGVISIFSNKKIKDNFLELSSTFGAFQFQQYQLKGGWKKEGTKLLVNGTHSRGQGFREHNAFENTNIHLRLFQEIGKKVRFSGQINYANSPLAEDPGGIDLNTLEQGRTLARERNIIYNSGEAIEQIKIGGHFDFDLDKKKEAALYGFYSNRNFTGLLPFDFGGWVSLTRNYVGQGGHYKMENQFPKGKNTLQMGYEFAYQNDHRQRYINNSGERGDPTLDQIESFINTGFYILDHFRINKLLITAGLRYDFNLLAADDRFIVNGDQSSRIDLSAFNPSLGLNYEIARQFRLYANIRTGFETPSLSELSANPNGQDGFNTNLNAQRVTNYEIGAKGILFDKLDTDVTFFYINTNDDLVPFELAEFPERTFYRNAGSTSRLGMELNTRYQINSTLALAGSYTLSDFTYEAFENPGGNFAGNLLPGIPKHMGSLLFTYSNETGINIRLQHRFIGDFFAEDANKVNIPFHQITDLSLSYSFLFKKIKWTPFLGINNLLNEEYNDNIRLNAFGGRYFEPAAGVNIYGGVGVRFIN